MRDDFHSRAGGKRVATIDGTTQHSVKSTVQRSQIHVNSQTGHRALVGEHNRFFASGVTGRINNLFDSANASGSGNMMNSLPLKG